MFTAYSISTLGDWFDMIAIFVLMAYTWHADPFLVGLVPITFALPGILFSSFAGVLADRWRKVPIMMSVSLVSGVLTILLVFVNNIYLVFLILLLRSTVGLFQEPAEQALTRAVVGEDLLLKATSYNQLMNQIAKIGGPILGGVIISFLSAKLCLAINAVSFIASGLILLTLLTIRVADKDDQEQQDKQSFHDSWKEGWKYIYKNKVIFWTMIIGISATMVIQLVDSQFAVLFRVIAPNRPSLIGWAMASVGLGAVLSISRLNKLKELNYGWMIGMGSFLLGVGFAGIGMLEHGFHSLVAVILGIIAGIGNGMWMVTFNFVLQNESPKKMVGRVFGIVNVMMSVVLIIAPLSGGIFIHYKGPVYIFQFVGWTVIGIGLLIIIFRNKLYPSRENTPQSMTLEQ